MIFSGSRGKRMSKDLNEKTIRLIEKVGKRAIMRAGDLISKTLGSPLSINKKGQSDFVTNIDRESESIIIDEIRRNFPDHNIISEEIPSKGMGIGMNWIIDPVDGTTNFIHGFPFVAVSIGVCQDDEVIMGFILDPIRNELFFAIKGNGATLNGHPIRVRDIKNLQDSLIATGFPFRAKEWIDPYLATFREIFLKVSGIRRAGSAALDLAYVACGRVDGFWEAGLKAWDVAAGGLIVREAGGIVSDFWGTEDYIKNGHIICGNEFVYGFLLGEVGKFLAPAIKGKKES
jgi:myo-inositol-1(or 4)-monophosphatase